MKDSVVNKFTTKKGLIAGKVQKNNWCAREDLNLQPLAPEADALSN